MSLDVYLRVPNERVRRGGSGIFVREDGQTKEVTRAEWDEKFPGREPIILNQWGDEESGTETVFSRNITHNLGGMANAAGIYEALWRPEEVGIERAAQLIEPLTKGIEILLADPERFKALNPPNGWGSYDGLVAFAQEYLHACEEYPGATVYVSR